MVKTIDDVPDIDLVTQDDAKNDSDEDHARDDLVSSPGDPQPTRSSDDTRASLTTPALPLMGIRSFYHGKVIFITGATGFLGKALLWKLLADLRDQIDKVYLLLRMSSAQRRFSNPNVRLQEDILSDKAFVHLRRKMGATAFDQLVKDKIQPLNGDLTEPNLGLSDDDQAIVIKHVNVIFHCAAITDNHDLDVTVKINALGTAHVVQLANECGSLSSLLHLSPMQIYGATTAAPNALGILPMDAAPQDLINAILTASPEELHGFLSQIQQHYTTPLAFSKSLAEHILIDDIRKKQESRFQQFPVGILRLAPVGPSLHEPLQGWADNVNGINGVLLLAGKGSRVIDTGHGDIPADVVPVDIAVRAMLATAATMRTPPATFRVPEQDLPNTATDAAETDAEGEDSPAPMPVRDSREDLPCFPAIQAVSMLDCGVISWRQAYEGIRWYWTRSGNVQLAPAASYFTASAQGLSRARSVMNSIRSAASGYMGGANGSSAPPIARNSIISASTSTDGRRSPRTSSPRHSHRASRYMDKAARIAPGIMRAYNPHLKQLHAAIIGEAAGAPPMAPIRQLFLILTKNDENDENAQSGESEDNEKEDFDAMARDFDPMALLGQPDEWMWTQYFILASYGVDYYVNFSAHIRVPLPGPEWQCALLFQGGANDADTMHVMNRQARSELISADQITKRTSRMIDHVKQLLVYDDYRTDTRRRTNDAVWMRDIDDCLDDWSNDTSILQAMDQDRRHVLGKWKKKVGNNDDAVRVVVLNDKRVNQAILHITQKAGVSRQTAVNEALRILTRMSERTQLGFVWFVGSFLKSLFDNMFDSIRVNKEQLRNLRHAILGKRVVYVPISKSVLDPILVWYFAIRYHLPVPALVCDEVMAQLGPISDIYRLAGAYYVKREKQQRSPLSSAVTAAYTQVLLREHGALSFCFERTRSRTGKLQAAFDDGMMEMVMESTLQSNQSRASGATSRAGSMDDGNVPPSPDSPASATMSVDSTTGTPRKPHRDIVVVPINISYESVPELPFLIDQVLDQQQPIQQQMQMQMQQQNRPSASTSLPSRPSATAQSSQQQRSMSIPSASPSSAASTAPNSVPGVPHAPVRPSQSMDRRNGVADSAKKYGAVDIGLGRVVSVQETANLHKDVSDEAKLAAIVANRVQVAQREALVVTPVSLVCAIILYGRAVGGVAIGKIKELLTWLHQEVIDKQYIMDWQDGEDIDAIVLNSFKLINDAKNLIIEGKTLTDDTNVRVNDHADNIMTLSYYANQMVNPFLMDAFFAVVYLSFTEDQTNMDDFMDRFRFLVQLLEKEFVILADIDKVLPEVMAKYEAQHVLRKSENGYDYHLQVTMEKDPVQYEQLMLLASLIYPTIDNYWITSCSLSALERVPTLPRSIVPLLSQWIATHLITGRRTIYREVLSTESSRNAVAIFMAMGFLTEYPAKQKLTPDAQILLHELKIPTSETVIELTGQNSDGGSTPVSAGDPEGMMKALMAQIQMNRANSNMADLCQQIDSYRLGAASQRESFQNAQVFQKCLKQIKGIIQVDTTFAQRRRVELNDIEDAIVQLVYALRVSSNSAASPQDATARALRRISEAYNLK
ncbi:male sterility protein-domain-containing protein [Gongronella butleri]|nr:male sterility protein-domain-containing protein [Gongronella butleri]